MLRNRTFLCAVHRVKSDAAEGRVRLIASRVKAASVFGSVLQICPPLSSAPWAALGSQAPQTSWTDTIRLRLPRTHTLTYTKTQAANTHTHPGETQASYYSKRLPSLTLAFSSQAHFSPTSSAPPRAAVCSCVSPAPWECVRMCVCVFSPCLYLD